MGGMKQILWWVRKLVGHKFDTRFHWGEVAWYGWHWRVSVKWCPEGFSHRLVHVAVGPVGLFVFVGRERGDGAMRGRDRAYGFYSLGKRSVVWRWGVGYWSWDLPFLATEWERTEVLDLDGRQAVFAEGPGDPRDWRVRFEEEEAAKAANCLKTRYHYVRRNGEVQTVVATVAVMRMTWHRKWARWWKESRTSIDVEFSGEVGERAGSWKGGTVGCGEVMRPGETALECLQRMQRERKFT